VVADRKVVGSAQVRRGGALLQHGSLLLDGDQAVVGRVTRGPAPPDGSISLARVLGRSVTWQEAADAILAAATRAWPPVIPPTPGSVREVEQAAALRVPRYRSPAWTWQGAHRD
jgi:lipoate-protein ligase A